MTNSLINLCEIEPGIVQLTMQDKKHKNLLTREMISGLRESFDVIQNNSAYKAVILTGYDNYFCSGGTQEGLISIHDGKAKFTDANVFNLALDCHIPVISAMQGHGIGGGVSMGLFADFVILSRESVYTANYMNYGFTPGMGATYIIPKKLGLSLGNEMLMTGRNYRGQELKDRGISFPVLAREDVFPRALQIARELAGKPRESLITLKDHLVASIRKELPAFIQKELDMHEKTFHQLEVKQLILERFGN